MENIHSCIILNNVIILLIINVFGSPNDINGILQYNKASMIARDGPYPFKDKSI